MTGSTVHIYPLSDTNWASDRVRVVIVDEAGVTQVQSASADRGDVITALFSQGSWRLRFADVVIHAAAPPLI